jgi:hypothetical protein
LRKSWGIFEGVFRKDKVLSDGTTRNAAYYSILDDEWELARLKIENLIREKQNSVETL